MSGKVVSGPRRAVTDGPYAEAKDLLLGFIVIHARDLDEAVEIAHGCPIVAGGGSVEVRPAGAHRRVTSASDGPRGAPVSP